MVLQRMDDQSEDAETDRFDRLHIESNKKRASVLLGSALLQLPIWGLTRPLAKIDGG